MCHLLHRLVASLDSLFWAGQVAANWLITGLFKTLNHTVTVLSNQNNEGKRVGGFSLGV